MLDIRRRRAIEDARAMLRANAAGTATAARRLRARRRVRRSETLAARPRGRAWRRRSRGDRWRGVRPRRCATADRPDGRRTSSPKPVESVDRCRGRPRDRPGGPHDVSPQLAGVHGGCAGCSSRTIPARCTWRRPWARPSWRCSGRPTNGPRRPCRGPAAPATVLAGAAWCRPCGFRECPLDHRCMTSIPAARVIQTVSERL